MHNTVSHNLGFRHEDEEGEVSYIEGDGHFGNLESGDLEHPGFNNLMRQDLGGDQSEYETHEELMHTRGTSVVHANGMNYDNVSAPNFIELTDNITTANSVFNINNEEISMPMEHYQ